MVPILWNSREGPGVLKVAARFVKKVFDVSGDGRVIHQKASVHIAKGGLIEAFAYGRADENRKTAGGTKSVIGWIFADRWAFADR